VSYQEERVDSHPFLPVEVDIVRLPVDDVNHGLFQADTSYPEAKHTSIRLIY
jgi:hypothetical protein